MPSYKEVLYEALNSLEDVSDISIPERERLIKECGCSDKEFYAILAEYKKDNPKKLKNKKNQDSDVEYEIEPLQKGVTFRDFCRLYSYPFYKGVFEFQMEMHNKIYGKPIAMVNVARGHGKSIYLGNSSQWAMSTDDTDILYLGWTKRREEMAENIYKFFDFRGELISDKKTSQNHFKTIYGTKFDTFSVKSKEVLGMHEVGELEREITDANRYLENFVRNSSKKLWIIIDDPIDETFDKERHKERSLEERFLSTIKEIQPNYMTIVGTRKFEGDFFDFIEGLYKNDLVIYKQSPYLAEDHQRYNKDLINNPSNLLAPERWIDVNHPSYKKYRQILQAIEKKKFTMDQLPLASQKLAKFRDLSQIKKYFVNGGREFYWHSEYMQNPKPTTGTVFNHLTYVSAIGSPHDYSHFCINIDRATTVKDRSDETGLTIELKHMDGHRLVVDDLTGKFDMLDCVLLVDGIYKEYKNTYINAIPVIILEKQGGGDEFERYALRMGFEWHKYIQMVHSRLNKYVRIKDYMFQPIKQGLVRFLSALRYSKCVQQILSFPNSGKIDAFDSLANGDWELRTMVYITFNSDEFEDRLRALAEFRKETIMFQNNPLLGIADEMDLLEELGSFA